MHDNPDSTDRRPAEYLLFACAFGGLVVAGGGVILCSPGIAVTGATICLLTVLGLLGRNSAPN